MWRLETFRPDTILRSLFGGLDRGGLGELDSGRCLTNRVESERSCGDDLPDRFPQRQILEWRLKIPSYPYI